MRIGFGFDVHPFADGRDLVLGGVKIPHERGLDGHSDADVILHALMDAMLGALALGDIGKHFPNTEERFRGADSRELLLHVYEMICGRGYELGNIDVMVLAEEPKIAPYILQMQSAIADTIGVSTDQISIKATTTEKLGFVGRREGIAAEAVALLVRREESGGQ